MRAAAWWNGVVTVFMWGFVFLDIHAIWNHNRDDIADYTTALVFFFLVFIMTALAALGRSEMTKVEFLRALREYDEKKEALLVADEDMKLVRDYVNSGRDYWIFIPEESLTTRISAFLKAHREFEALFVEYLPNAKVIY